MIYGDGVYEISADFLRNHPGGPLIRQAAGADVEPFWARWAHHHHSPKVGEYLEQLRIGALHPAAATSVGISKSASVVKESDPYAEEPMRDHLAQTVFTHRPYCSETPTAVLRSSYLTSAGALYVRNHAPVPECGLESHTSSTNTANTANTTTAAAEAAAAEAAAAAHEITFSKGTDTTSDECGVVMTIDALKKLFDVVTVTSVLQCAGNRASEDIAATGPSPFSGSPYEVITTGMLGNAQWSGVRLADVLPALYPEECTAAQRHGGGEWHVVFIGADGYSTSTPLARVLQRENDCLLATHMNGEALTADHGFPIRAVLPGIAGARNVKWLESMVVTRGGPAVSPWNDYYYRDAELQQIQALPLQSLVLNARYSTRGRDDTAAAVTTAADIIEASGVAYSGGSGTAIARVECSVDGGDTWSEATLLTEEIARDDSLGNFGWVRWTVQIKQNPCTGCVQKTPSGVGQGDQENKNKNTNTNTNAVGVTAVTCRAFDTQGKGQPRVAAKQRGYLYNGWSTMAVASKEKEGGREGREGGREGGVCIKYAQE
jgi:sulfite oxidase